MGNFGLDNFGPDNDCERCKVIQQKMREGFVEARNMIVELKKEIANLKAQNKELEETAKNGFSVWQL